jgi:hypothetical protein
MATDWTAVLIGFVGGSLTAAVISAFVKHWIFHPVISVRLDERKGSYGGIPFVSSDGQKHHDARYLRLHVENTGLSSIKGCSGHITEITKHIWGTRTPAQSDVIDVGWVNKHKSTIDIPRGAFFHMDVATLHLLLEGRKLEVAATQVPTHLLNFFSDKATYEFEMLIVAENARPRRVQIKFDYDPQSDELRFKPVIKTRYPWWARWRWLRSTG